MSDSEYSECSENEKVWIGVEFTNRRDTEWYNSRRWYFESHKSPYRTGQQWKPATFDEWKLKLLNLPYGHYKSYENYDDKGRCENILLDIYYNHVYCEEECMSDGEDVAYMNFLDDDMKNVNNWAKELQIRASKKNTNKMRQQTKGLDVSFGFN
mgnify:CR=1 FL=1